MLCARPSLGFGFEHLRLGGFFLDRCHCVTLKSGKDMEEGMQNMRGGIKAVQVAVGMTHGEKISSGEQET